ncbi:MAG: CBS domain-containing protein [Salinisphaera sp.]|jgi:CBS-domain-containing membrane protein|nr:CBS domain-containing protein [Salinisphaera sp.]
MTNSHALSTYPLGPGVVLAKAAAYVHTSVTHSSPAFEVMTDFAKVRAATISPLMSLAQAEQSMIYQGVRLLFVIDNAATIVGLITTTDMAGPKPIQIVHDSHLHYDQLTVADVMTGLDMLNAIELERIERATVGDAIATLKTFGRNHLLVVEGATGETPRRARGLISRSQIELQLGELIDITPVARSFSEIEKALL